MTGSFRTKRGDICDSIFFFFFSSSSSSSLSSLSSSSPSSSSSSSLSLSSSSSPSSLSSLSSSSSPSSLSSSSSSSPSSLSSSSSSSSPSSLSSPSSSSFFFFLARRSECSLVCYREICLVYLYLLSSFNSSSPRCPNPRPSERKSKIHVPYGQAVLLLCSSVVLPQTVSPVVWIEVVVFGHESPQCCTTALLAALLHWATAAFWVL